MRRNMLIAIVLMGVVAWHAVSASEMYRLSGMFTDLDHHWGEAAIYEAVDKGYVQGYPDGSSSRISL